MGTLSKKPKAAPASSTKTASFYTPFGNVIGGQGKATFNPAISADQQSFLTNSQAQMNDIAGKLPTSFNAADMYGGPGYDSALGLLSSPVMREQGVDRKNLEDSLSARNQLGGSYEAYAKNLMGQRHNDQMRQIQDQARQYAFQGNQQAYQNQISALSNLGAMQTNLYDQLFAPLKYSSAYAGTNAAQQQAALNYMAQQNASRNSGLSGLLGGIGSIAGAIGGSFIPGAGTALGARVGGMAGGAAGSLF